ncbi:MAG: NAD-dependent epimerase/dehydratase family protein [Chloroflexi bacterium]|nr:NAD-dependent epimerase/dehydratase family protein [Chloroflexota bacterium]
MRALVLGGSNFVGANLVRQLVAGGHNVTAFNRGQTQAQYPPEVQRLYGDRKNHAQVREVLGGKDYDVVYDISGLTADDTAIMVELFSGRVGHYIYTSSAGVYERRYYAPVTEDFPYNEIEYADYARGKAATERLLFQAHRERGFPASMVRPWMVFGPRQPSAAREQIFFLRVERNRPVFLPFNGYVHLQYGHVADLAGLFIKMTGNPRCFGEAYNAAGPDVITMNRYLQIIGRLAGKEVDLVYLDYLAAQEAVTAKRDLWPMPWHSSKMASIQKAKDHFGFWPKYNSDQCTEDTYRWFKAQGLDKMEYDFSFEDQLLARYGNDPRYRVRISPDGDLPQTLMRG